MFSFWQYCLAWKWKWKLNLSCSFVSSKLVHKCRNSNRYEDKRNLSPSTPSLSPPLSLTHTQTHTHSDSTRETNNDIIKQFFLFFYFLNKRVCVKSHNFMRSHSTLKYWQNKCGDANTHTHTQILQNTLTNIHKMISDTYFRKIEYRQIM